MSRFRSSFLVAILLICFYQTSTSQAWEQVYPSWPIDEYTSVLYAGTDTVFATARNFTLLRSTDRGAHWQHLFRSLGEMDITDCGYDAGKLYLLPGGWQYFERIVADTISGFIFAYDLRTGDTSTIRYPSGIGDPTDCSITRDLSVTQGTIFVLQNAYSGVSTDSRLLRSLDGGVSWKSVRLPDSMCTTTSTINFRDSLNGLLTVRTDLIESIYYSTADGGDTWRRHGNLRYPYSGTGDMPLGLPMCWMGDSTAIVSTGGNGLFLTRDAGITWKLQCANEPTIPSWIGFSNTGMGFMTGFGNDIYRSSDFGVSWIQVREASTIFEYSQGAISGDSTIILITDAGARIRSTDAGLTWDSQQENAYRSIGSIQFLTDSIGYASVSFRTNSLSSSGKVRTTDGGRTWRDFPLPSLRWWNLIHISAHVSYAWTAKGSSTDTLLCRTTNAGQTWHICLMDTIPSFSPTVPAGKRNRGEDTLFFPDHGLMLKTTDGGLTWDSYPSVPTRFGAMEYVLAIDMSLRRFSWALSWNKILRSGDDGRLWDTVYTRPPDKGFFSDIFVHDSMNVSVIGDFGFGPRIPGVTGYLHRSTDGGSTWVSTEIHGLHSHYSPTIALDGTGYGIYSPSFGAGTWLTWSFRNTGNFWSTYREQFRVNSREKVFPHFLDSRTGWAIAHRAAIYRTSTGGINNVLLPPTPEYSHLSQNYPNPVSTMTTVPYTVSGNGPRKVRLDLYDSMGRHVRRLLEADVDPGDNALPIDASALRPGLYFVHLISGTQTQVKKIMVLR